MRRGRLRWPYRFPSRAFGAQTQGKNFLHDNQLSPLTGCRTCLSLAAEFRLISPECFCGGPWEPGPPRGRRPQLQLNANDAEDRGEDDDNEDNEDNNATKLPQHLRGVLGAAGSQDVLPVVQSHLEDQSGERDSQSVKIYFELTFGFMIPSFLKRAKNMSMENTSLHSVGKAGLDEFFEQLLWDGFAGLVVLGHPLKGLPLPDPVLQHLRRSLHKVPLHVKGHSCSTSAQSWCMTCPNSWKYVSTSSCCRSDGASAVGLLKLATMAATDI
ncbi:hypothetical protein EYF80_024059 [Liparis tanakae]|uniref:Uncharacterized protein n=1 Tax=Liparis tanakae TaxID=230148 RepID=A0A4Z2HIX9_9TELE|nr:hypothetical protein EYF80_024059 [Liparis tanakae]